MDSGYLDQRQSLPHEAQSLAGETGHKETTPGAPWPPKQCYRGLGFHPELPGNPGASRGWGIHCPMEWNNTEMFGNMVGTQQMLNVEGMIIINK